MAVFDTRNPMAPSPTDSQPTELETPSYEGFLSWLGDSPFTALSAGQVRISRARVFVLGDPASPQLALIQARGTPSEPSVFGPDIGSIWSLLSQVKGWDCVNVASDSAAEVAGELERRTGVSASTLSERYYVLERDPGAVMDARVRVLNPADLDLVRGSDPVVQPFFEGHGGIESTLRYGVSSGVVQGSSIVSAVTTSAWIGSNVDLGAVTIPPSRGQGLATASARHVCIVLRGRGLSPVWAASELNPASWHIPERLGFRFVGRREYAILAGLRPNGFRG